MVTEEILSSTTFVTEWTSISYCKASDFFFWLIFLVSSQRSLATMRFPHSSSMNTIIGESFISIQFSSSSTLTFFSEGFLLSMKP